MKEIELQLHKVLESVSLEEKKRNRALSKQTAKLARAILVLRRSARLAEAEKMAAEKK